MPDRSPEELSVAERLAHSVVRLECALSDGNTSTGTGFFFAFAQEGDRLVPAIVTNRHVVAGASRGKFHLTIRNARGGACIGRTVTVDLGNFESRWMPHPQADIDLCAMPIAPLLREAEAKGHAVFYVNLGRALIPSEEDLNHLDLVEDITMVGYPIGLWDRTNNMPLFRRGATATHPALDWNGKPEFLIDAACFPGSSGSPVFLYNTGTYSDRRSNSVVVGGRLKLLGVLYAGPQHVADGTIVVAPVPTAAKPMVQTAIPLNLGLVIKSKALHAFDEAFRRGEPPAPAV